MKIIINKNSEHFINIDIFENIISVIKKEFINIELDGYEIFNHPSILNIIDLAKNTQNNLIVYTPCTFSKNINKLSQNIDEFVIKISKKNIDNNLFWENIQTIQESGKTISILLTLDDNLSNNHKYLKAINKINPKNIRIKLSEDFSILRNEYFKRYKQSFIQFIKLINEMKLKIILECRQLPACVFSRYELELIEKTSIRGLSPLGCCVPEFYIDEDMIMKTCLKKYKNYNLSVFDLKSFGYSDTFSNIVVKHDIDNYVSNCVKCPMKKEGICYCSCLNWEYYEKT